MRSGLIVLVLGLSWSAARVVHAGPCRDDNWQPTYVHDLTRPGGQPYYVMPDGSFVPLPPPWQQSGEQYCVQYGVRDARGFTNCRQYPRVQCGCDAQSGGNSTCSRFFNMLASSSPPTGTPQQPPPSRGGGASDTVSVSARSGTPVQSHIALDAGRTYTIEVSGVFSCWDDHTDGVDGFYCYATWRCPTPQVWGQLLIDDKSMSDIAKEHGEPLALHGDHVYSTTIVGSGRPISLQIADAKNSAGDNHGALTVRISPGRGGNRPPPPSGQGLDQGYDRYGGDYRDFDLPSGNAADCRAACVSDERCRSFAMSLPGAWSAAAHCWLKDQVPPRTPSAGRVSGVVPPRQYNDGMDHEVDRYGGDYRDFDLPSGNPADCRAACAAEQRCRAFAMTRPGAWAASAHCWLKDQVPEPMPSAGRVSGVMRR